MCVCVGGRGGRKQIMMGLISPPPLGDRFIFCFTSAAPEIVNGYAKETTKGVWLLAG